MTKEPITKSGFDLLKKNLEKLKNVERPRIVDAIKKAREFGDLRENAEYHAAKEDLYLLEKKIQDIEIKVLNAQVVELDDIKSNNKILFGSTVTIRNLESKVISTYKIIGDGEADISKREISIKSPMAQKLLFKEKNAKVSIVVNNNIMTYEILDIKYV